MNDLEDARKLWLEQEPRFARYAFLVADRVRSAIRPLGIWSEVQSRAKTTDSVLKKLIKKPKHDYASLPDKAGVRIIIRYRSDLIRVVEVLNASLHCGPVDWKLGVLDTFGYASVHLDFVRLLESDREQRMFPVDQFWVELQLRTLAQHLWSEMSHDSIYKNDETIQIFPDDVKRRVHLMAAQIEVADREFDRLAKETRAEDAAEFLRFLETSYYKLTSNRPDVELSLLTLRTILPLYQTNLQQVEEMLSAFLISKESFLQKRYAQAQEGVSPPVSPLFYQPEALALYERLLDDRNALRRAWSNQFPDKELENFAYDFGISFK